MGVEHKGHDLKDSYTLKIPTLFTTIRFGLGSSYERSNRLSSKQIAIEGFSPSYRGAKESQVIQRHPKKDCRQFSPEAETPVGQKKKYAKPHQLQGVESKMIDKKNSPPSFRQEQHEDMGPSAPSGLGGLVTSVPESGPFSSPIDVALTSQTEHTKPTSKQQPS